MTGVSLHEISGTSAVSKLEKRGRVIQVERFLESGLFDPTHTVTCILVRFDLPGGECVLPFRCAGLSNPDPYLVQEGDEVIVTAASFDGKAKNASGLSIVWDSVVKGVGDEPLTETGIVTRVSRITVFYGDKQYTLVLVAAELTDTFNRRHPVVFSGTPSDHLHIAFVAVGQKIQMTYSSRGSDGSAEVSLKTLTADLNFRT